MIGAARFCQVCKEAWLFKTNSRPIKAFYELYEFLRAHVDHVRAHNRIRKGLNEAGLFYMGMQK